jgi:hypothetical protein
LVDIVGLAVGFFDLLKDNACFVACIEQLLARRMPNTWTYELTIGRAECQQLQAFAGDESGWSVRHVFLLPRSRAGEASVFESVARDGGLEK